MKGRRFNNVDDNQRAVHKQLTSIAKEQFQNCFEDFQHRWNRCIISRGDYFEGTT